MCPPDHFDVAYSINPWMDTRVAVDRRRAGRQWSALVETLEDAGAQVEVVEPRRGLPDMVFTANAGVVVGDSFVPALMRHRERQGERPHFEAWFAARGFRVRPLAGGVLQEGAGDALPFGGVLVAGCRTRSTAEAYAQLARSLGTATLVVELRDPRYYHVDLTFCPLDNERAMLVPSGWTEEGLAAIAEIVPEPLVLRADEAEAFCANSVVVERTVIMPACPPRLRRQLERCGFEVVVVEVSEFIKAGGAVRCLTLPLDVPPSALSAPAAGTTASAPGADLRPVRAAPLGAHRDDDEHAREIDGQGEAAEAGDPIELAENFGAHNYHPLDVVIERAAGAWVYDREGRPYLDALAAYSALNFGHHHPRLLAAARRQLDRLTLTSRAFHNDQLGPFCRDLARLCGAERVLPMNTGAEAIETAIKVARKWGYELKGVRPEHAKIVVCEGNFHGRTVTIVSCSDDPVARRGFGPFTPGFKRVPYGDLEALAAALADEDVVAFLVEPIQGEAGVIVPPAGYLRGARKLCNERGVLLIADEIQSGLGRTGTTFACEHERVKPDVYVLGKALGGGIMPLSAVVSSDELLGVLRPGEHGSTFGGNPLACAIGREVIALLSTGEYQRRAARLGAWFLARLGTARLPGVAEIRGRGLWFGIELGRDAPPARAVCERLLREGVLAKETHERTIRLAPPLVVGKQDLQWALAGLERALEGC
jgi:ornithine--oxo-acid transaminase